MLFDNVKETAKIQKKLKIFKFLVSKFLRNIVINMYFFMLTCQFEKYFSIME